MHFTKELFLKTITDIPFWKVIDNVAALNLQLIYTYIHWYTLIYCTYEFIVITFITAFKIEIDANISLKDYE